MKYAVYFLAVFCFTFQMAKASVPQNLPLTEVQVYLQSAKLTHKGNLTLKPGKQMLQLKGLASEIDETSLQLFGNDQIEILSFQLLRTPLRTATKPLQLAAMMDSLDQMQFEMELLRANKEVFIQEQQLILGNKAIGGQQGVSVEQLQKMADFYRLRLQDLNVRIAKGQNEVNLLAKKSADLKAKIEKERKALPEFEVMLEVQINCTKAGQQQLTISYLSEASFWEPVYELRSAGMGKPLQIELNAKISQHTGLHWDQVNLRISTALPQRHTSKPELNPWVLDFYEAVQMYGAADSEMGVRMSRAESMPEPAKAKVNNFVRSSAFLNLEYLPKQQYTVKSEKSEIIPLESHLLSATYRHYAAPRLSKEAYLMAYVLGWDSLRLLPGQASIYFEQTLISKSWLDFSALSDTLELALGIDQAIKIDFKEQLSFTDNKRLMQQQRKQLQYTCEIRNSHASAIQLTLEDHVPVSVQKEIVVDDIQLAGAEHTVQTGRIKWQLEIPANGIKKINYGFSVRYPKNKRITNL
ncbi:MAG: DUF4139 domain-containing protein [Sphingobacteriaceae bacterium]|nr:DUF4139 domain-containing protein [Sphingobacteriaceae bacterium]